MFAYRDGRLFAEEVEIAAIAEAVGAPFYVYSRATLLERLTAFQTAFAGAETLIAFAVKANGALAVLSALARAGAGADIVSAGELDRARKAGVAANRIVFSGVAKTEAEMAAALDAGIRQFNVESAPELAALEETAKADGQVAPVAIRLNPGVAAGGHVHISTGKAGDKFGVGAAEAVTLYARAAASPHLAPLGVAVHIGSQILELDAFALAFARCEELITSLRRDGLAVSSLDIGGGLGVAGAGIPAPDLAAYGDMAAKLANRLDVALICEPGRAIAAEAGLMIARVVYVKEAPPKRFLILNAGMNDLARTALYGAAHPIRPVIEKSGAAVVTYDVVGPVCETTDRFSAAAALPELQAGDLVAFGEAGAYGATLASEYNARPRIAEVMVSGRDFAVIRRRPTFDEMTGFDAIPDWV
ncbi:MAG: diaminopimelate decarboxylase [Parvularculaceae bacterium]